ncbi:FadR/GntR family transcriptional regulator [Mucilaginibacter sp. FT3.2]|uniref:FadR/GntR family transcriptional regulator n=1 Tax=Mucilaginibacter sp. FT3.2 TaxID=2723090 RepID=UPI001617B6CC|nr:FadR/GntR family transcriptional regulator [Mucilaginibacter sp. FT3.2]MBB6231235.1 DNA-binding FadR family transcriptional regulator [Mucilaginibacter sp. FT3.2]
MKKEKLSDQVAARIRQDIKENKYKAGEKIPAEPELMKSYAVGRSSVREAIKSLAMAGVLQVKQGDGTYVNDTADQQPMEQRLKNASFEEINAVRKLLEREIVGLAAELHTPNDVAEMDRQLIARKQAILTEDKAACANADIAFHMVIATAAKNSVLTGLYQNFTQTIRSFFSQREVQGISHFAMSHHLHEDLFNAIRARKKKQAVEIITHILNNNY